MLSQAATTMGASVLVAIIPTAVGWIIFRPVLDRLNLEKTAPHAQLTLTIAWCAFAMVNVLWVALLLPDFDGVPFVGKILIAVAVSEIGGKILKDLFGGMVLNVIKKRRPKFLEALLA